MSGNSLLHNCIQLEKMNSTSNATPCDSGAKPISDCGAVVNANVEGPVVKQGQSSEPELKNGSVCEKILAKLEQEAAIAVSEAAALREAFDKKYTIDGKLPWGLLYGARSNLQFDMDLGELNAAESRASEAEWRVECIKQPITVVRDEPVGKLTSYGKVLEEEEYLKDCLERGFMDETEFNQRMEALCESMCKYHCHEGHIGFKTPGQKFGKNFWPEGCAGHDHKVAKYNGCGDSRHGKEGKILIHIGPIYEEDTHSSSQPVAEVSAADCQREERVEVGATPTTSSADGNAPRDTSSEPFIGAGAGNYSGPVNPRRKRRDVVRATLTANSADGKCTSGHVEEKPLLTPTVTTDMGVSAGGAQREGQHETVESNDSIVYLSEVGHFSVIENDDDVVLRDMEEQIEVLHQQHPEMQEITVSGMLKEFRLWEQRRTFWEALVKGIQGKLKVKKNKSIRSKLEVQLEQYWKNYETSLERELYYQDTINSMVPGLLEFHVVEDRRFWFKMEKIGALNETIAAFLGRSMTAQEKEDLLHSQKILMEHLVAYECVR